MGKNCLKQILTYINKVYDVDWNNEYKIVLNEHFISEPWYDLHKMLIQPK